MPNILIFRTDRVGDFLFSLLFILFLFILLNPSINSSQKPACAQFSIAYDAAIAVVSSWLPYNLSNSLHNKEQKKDTGRKIKCEAKECPARLSLLYPIAQTNHHI